jgi:ribonuclease P protein component
VTLFLKNNRLPKKLILRRKKNIEEIFENSRKWFGKYLNIYYVKSEGDPAVAFFVKKKIGKAVERNYNKRLIREFYRTHKEYFFDKKCIFIIKKKMDSMTVLQKEIEIFLHHEKTINRNH